jgi:hypothetical protein
LTLEGDNMAFGFEDFIAGIDNILHQINILYKKSEKLSDEVNDQMELINYEHNDKKILLGKYVDLLTAITHEIGSEIGFYKDDIKKMNKYLYFRMEYNDFSDEILEKIIDSELTLMEKKDMFKGYGTKETLNLLKTIRNDWNIIFENVSYKKIRDKII